VLSKYLLITLLLLFPFGQLTKIPIFNGTGSLYLHDILIIFYLIISIKKSPALIPKIIKHKYFIAFFISSLISLLLALKFLTYDQLLVSGLYLFRLLSYILVFYLLIHDVSLNKTDLKPYLIISFILNLILGFGQYFLFPSLEPLFAAGWDRHFNRLAGSWLDTGFTGLILSLQFLYLLNLDKVKIYTKSKNTLSHFQSKARNQETNASLDFSVVNSFEIARKNVEWGINNIYLRIILLFLTFTAVMLTYSRSSFLALLMGSVVLLLRKKMVKGIWFILGFFVIGLLLLPQTFGEGTKLLRMSTISSRLGSWEQGINLFVKKPILGYGFDSLRYVKKDIGLETIKWEVSHSAGGFENSLITLLATSGIVGTVLLLTWIIKLNIRNKHNPLVLASFVAVFVHGMFANSWFYLWVIIWLGLMLVLSD